MGEVYSWGSCEYFSLGLGKGVKSTVLPTPVTALSGIPIVKVATGEYHSAAISAEGDLYTWGWGGSFLFGE